MAPRKTRQQILFFSATLEILHERQEWLGVAVLLWCSLCWEAEAGVLQALAQAGKISDLARSHIGIKK